MKPFVFVGALAVASMFSSSAFSEDLTAQSLSNTTKSPTQLVMLEEADKSRRDVKIISKAKPSDDVGASAAASPDAVADEPASDGTLSAVEPTSLEDGAPLADEEKAAAAPKPKPKPLTPTLVATVDLTRQRMHVKINGVNKYSWKISSGRSGYRTPTGTYRPQWMNRMHYSKQYDNAPMPHSVFFHRGYAVHATYATGRLGAPASHGCIRLSPRNARTFFNLVKKHKMARTRISLHGVAKDRPVYAKRKRKKKTRKYAYKNPSKWIFSPQPYKQKMVWPGDQRRVYRKNRTRRRYN